MALLQQREEVELKMRPQGIVRWVNITVSGWAPGWKHPSSFEHLESESEHQIFFRKVKVNITVSGWAPGWKHPSGFEHLESESWFLFDILTIESEHHGQCVSTRMKAPFNFWKVKVNLNLLRYFEEWKWTSQWVSERWKYPSTFESYGKWKWTSQSYESYRKWKWKS